MTRDEAIVTATGQLIHRTNFGNKFIPAAPPNFFEESSSKLSFGYASKRFRTSSEGMVQWTSFGYPE